jgi:hypothetical protein
LRGTDTCISDVAFGFIIGAVFFMFYE